MSGRSTLATTAVPGPGPFLAQGKAPDDGEAAGGRLRCGKGNTFRQPLPTSTTKAKPLPPPPSASTIRIPPRAKRKPPGRAPTSPGGVWQRNRITAGRELAGVQPGARKSPRQQRAAEGNL